MGDKPGKKPKAKPPDVPKGAPKDLSDFVDCKGNTVTIKPGKLDWIPKEGLGEFVPDPDVSFEEDKNKPGTFNIKIKLGVTFTLPASIKDGKLDVDTSSVPVDKIKKGIDNWVKKLNDWLEANGKKIGGATLKGGAITITKDAVAAAPGKSGVKAGPFPHVPTGEKVGALGLVGLAVVFGLAFMNAGDETKTDEPSPSSAADTPPAEGLADQIGDVVISIEGEEPASGTRKPSSDGTFNFIVPLFAIGEPHRIEFSGSQGTLDTVTFTVPAASGPLSGVTTKQGGRVECVIDHTNPVPPGRSGAECTYIQPATDAASESTPDAGVEEQTDGKPWSLLAIPGAVLGLGGGLALDEERRRRKEGWSVGAGLESGGDYGQTYPDWDQTYPDWSSSGDEGPKDEGGFDPTTGTYPDWETNVPEPEAPAPPSPPRPDVM